MNDLQTTIQANILNLSEANKKKLRAHFDTIDTLNQMCSAEIAKAKDILGGIKKPSPAKLRRLTIVQETLLKRRRTLERQGYKTVS